MNSTSVTSVKHTNAHTHTCASNTCLPLSAHSTIQPLHARVSAPIFALPLSNNNNLLVRAPSLPYPYTPKNIRTRPSSSEGGSHFSPERFTSVLCVVERRHRSRAFLRLVSPCVPCVPCVRASNPSLRLVRVCVCPVCACVRASRELRGLRTTRARCCCSRSRTLAHRRHNSKKITVWPLAPLHPVGGAQATRRKSSTSLEQHKKYIIAHICLCTWCMCMRIYVCGSGS